jgi:hypothetical protein
MWASSTVLAGCRPSLCMASGWGLLGPTEVQSLKLERVRSGHKMLYVLSYCALWEKRVSNCLTPAVGKPSPNRPWNQQVVGHCSVWQMVEVYWALEAWSLNWSSKKAKARPHYLILSKVTWKKCIKLQDPAEGKLSPIGLRTMEISISVGVTAQWMGIKTYMPDVCLAHTYHSPEKCIDSLQQNSMTCSVALRVRSYQVVHWVAEFK